MTCGLRKSTIICQSKKLQYTKTPISKGPGNGCQRRSYLQVLLTIDFLIFPGVLAALFVGLKNLRITIEPVVLTLIPDQPGWCAVEMQIL